MVALFCYYFGIVWPYYFESEWLYCTDIVLNYYLALYGSTEILTFAYVSTQERSAELLIHCISTHTDSILFTDILW